LVLWVKINRLYAQSGDLAMATIGVLDCSLQ
jgi:hypothetical protein